MLDPAAAAALPAASPSQSPSVSPLPSPSPSPSPSPTPAAWDGQIAHVDPRSRHHPQNRRRPQAPAEDHGSSLNAPENAPPLPFSPALQHHPSHPDHRNYIKHLQLQQQRVHAAPPQASLPKVPSHFPTAPYTSPPQYQAYNPSPGTNTNSNHGLHFNSPVVRRVASVERGLGAHKPPASHRMSRMKSFGDRHRESHRPEAEMGFPPRRERLDPQNYQNQYAPHPNHQQHNTNQPQVSANGERNNVNGYPANQRYMNGRDGNGGPIHPQRVDSAERQAQATTGLPNGQMRSRVGVDPNIRKIGLPSNPSPSSSRPGSRPGSSRRESLTGLRGHQGPDKLDLQRSESPLAFNDSSNNFPLSPGLKMPLAFNSIARERGFSASSASSQPPSHAHNLPSPRPSNSAPDLAKSDTNSRSHHGYGPNAYYAQRRREHYNQSQPPSAHQSPHNSLPPDEARKSYRSANGVDRDSTVSSSAASSNAMTVDEAIGMYGSDTDQEELDYEDTARVEEEISRFHSENSGNEHISGPLSPYPIEFTQIRTARSPSPSSGLRPLSPTSRDHRPVLPSPPRVSEVLADDIVLPGEVEGEVQELEQREGATEQGREEETGRIEHGDAHDEDGGELPPAPVVVQDSPPTPPQSPPAVHVPMNPLENCMQPFIMPPHISGSVPPQLPFVMSGPVKDPIKDARDRYGFRKQTQYVSLEEYEAWSAGYEEIIQRRRKKWDQLMKESGLVYGDEVPVRFPPPSAKIKRYIRKGIPPEWRGNAWFWYAGGPARMAKNPGLYQRLLKEHTTSPDWEIIERDLHRTFPDNIFFKPDAHVYNNAPHQKKPSRVPETPIVQALRRVLVAYSIYVPKVGYCQSLNFLAGMLLLFMEEEKAFWMLYIITHQHLPGTHEVNLEGSTADQGVFMMSVRESLPAVWAKIAGGLDGASNMDLNPRDLPPVTLCTTPWFMSGFIGTLPVESILRVWDSWFYEGSKTLFRIALTILKIGETQIKAVNDPMEVFQVVQNIPRRLIDAGALLEACFRRRNGFGHLSQQDVDERRMERKAAYSRERAKLANPNGMGRKSKEDAGLRLEFGASHENDFLKMGGRFTRKMKLKV